MFNKIVFYDADGTVVVRDSMRKEVVEAMKELPTHGVLPVLSTGRSWPSIMYSSLNQLDLKTAITAAGGAVYIDGQLISHKYLTKEHLKEIVDYFDSYHLIYTLECNDALYMYPEKKEPYFRRFAPKDSSAEAKAESRKRANRFARQLKYTDDPLSLHVNKIHWYEEDVMYDDHKTPLTYDKIQRELGEKYNVKPLSFLPGASGGEINEKTVNKGQAMKLIMDHYGIDRENVYAIGDGDNDIEMLKCAGHAIAMGNGRENVKKAAEYITDDVEHCGFVTAMKHYGLL